MVKVAVVGSVAFGAAGGHNDAAVWHDKAKCSGGHRPRIWIA